MTQGPATPSPGEGGGGGMAVDRRSEDAGASPAGERDHPSPSARTSRARRKETPPSAARRSRKAASGHSRPKPSRAAARGGTRAGHCSGSSGMLPANYATIVSFLTTHGYTRLAAAGIAGHIYQESTENPDSVGSGGGGLIGF